VLAEKKMEKKRLIGRPRAEEGRRRKDVLTDRYLGGKRKRNRKKFSKREKERTISLCAEERGRGKKGPGIFVFFLQRGRQGPRKETFPGAPSRGGEEERGGFMLSEFIQKKDRPEPKVSGKRFGKPSFREGRNKKTT